MVGEQSIVFRLIMLEVIWEVMLEVLQKREG